MEMGLRQKLQFESKWAGNCLRNVHVSPSCGKAWCWVHVLHLANTWLAMRENMAPTPRSVYQLRLLVGLFVLTIRLDDTSLDGTS